MLTVEYFACNSLDSFVPKTGKKKIFARVQIWRLNSVQISVCFAEFSYNSTCHDGICNKNFQVLVKNLNFVAGMTRRFVSRTGLWARCSTSLLEFGKYLMSLFAETKRRVIPATKFKFFTSTWQFLLHITRELCGWESFCDRRPDC